MPVGAILGGIGAIAGSVNNIIQGGKQRKAANAINPVWKQYQADPEAMKRLAEWQNQRGLMAGYANTQRSIAGNFGNTADALSSGATDSSQLMATLAGAQGATNNAYQDLQTKQQQNNLGVQSGIDSARQGVIDENSKVYQSFLDKYKQDLAAKNALMGASMTNTQNGIMGLGSAAVMAGNGAFGTIRNPFGGGGGNGSFGSGGLNPDASTNQGGGSMPTYSDKRLKHNYYIVGKSPSGINIYEFSYNGSDVRYRGVLAQEVMEAAFVADTGFLSVDYSKIDVVFIEEKWATVKGYEGLYEVSNFGKIKSLEKYIDGKRGRQNIKVKRKEKLLKAGLNSDGYPVVRLYKNKESKDYKVHVLVWDAFGDANRNGHILQVDHKDGDKKNACILNLRLLSNRENSTFGKLRLKRNGLPTGVSYDKDRANYVNKYSAGIQINGKRIQLGRFPTVEDAAQVYQSKLRDVLHGEFIAMPTSFKNNY